jgi:hypothetical protein
MINKSPDLPKVTITNPGLAHPYPFQIAQQTLEFIQGTVFYYSLADRSSGKFFSDEENYFVLKADFINNGIEESAWDGGTDLIQKYQDFFKFMVFQNVLIAMSSHWDWYIRKLGSFVIFARNSAPSFSIMKVKDEKDLKRIGYADVLTQISLLEAACGSAFNLAQADKTNLHEMYLVRNLAIHNRWEVDQKYLDLSENKTYLIGDLRRFNMAELYSWQTGLQSALSKTWTTIGTIFKSAPTYPPS